MLAQKNLNDDIVESAEKKKTERTFPGIVRYLGATIIIAFENAIFVGLLEKPVVVVSRNL